MSYFTEEQSNRISYLIAEIEKLSDVEKLFLYLQLPCGRVEAREAKSKLNNSKSPNELFSKKPDQVTTQTYTWILSHLEVDSNVSLPKQEVYDEYRSFCHTNRIEPLCVADFGKAMKHAFPCIKPRRLGQRGNSRYCYSGLRKKYKLQPPSLPDLIEPTFCLDNDCSQAYNQIIKDCRDNPDECPLNNRQNFAGYTVMNLKIEHGNHYLPNDSQANFNGQPPEKRSILPQDTCRSVQRPSTLISGDIGLNGDSAQLQLNVSTSSDMIFSNQLPIDQSNNQPINSRHNGVSLVQQPGSPDDDDYRHNYQDTFAAKLPVARAASSVSSRDPPPAAEGFLYHPNDRIKQIQQGSESMLDGTVRNTASSSSNTPLNGDANCASDALPSSTHFNANIGSASNNNIVYLTSMSNATFDSCASPFQSPAHTPYPTMGGYLSQEIQDYYSNDCNPYTNA